MVQEDVRWNHSGQGEVIAPTWLEYLPCFVLFLANNRVKVGQMNRCDENK